MSPDRDQLLDPLQAGADWEEFPEPERCEICGNLLRNHWRGRPCLEDAVPVRLYAWGGTTGFHDYQLPSGEVVALHDEDDFIFLPDGTGLAKLQSIQRSREVVKAERKGFRP